MTANLLVDALGYAARGFSVIPTKGKIPTIRAWKPYASAPPTNANLRKWFTSNRPDGVAVICGDVSGGLVCRDFDVVDSYELWAESHPKLAKTLPTSETTRGRHVYFRYPLRRIVVFDDGELRGKGYCLLPRSKPETREYRWINPLPDGPLPCIDPWEIELAFDGTEPTEPTESTEAIFDYGYKNDQIRSSPAKRTQSDPSELENQIPTGANEDNLPDDLGEAVELAIQNTLPRGIGERNKRIFSFVRALKAIPALTDADAESVRGIVKEWHRRARPVIETKPFEETWIDFRRAWKRVILPLGDDPMGLMLERAVTTGLPTVALEYEQPELRVLVALCRELQRAAGERPFWLACRTVQRLLGVGRVTAGRWLGLLVDDKILFLVEKGSRQTGRASRYCYIADDT